MIATNAFLCLPLKNIQTIIMAYLACSVSSPGSSFWLQHSQKSWMQPSSYFNQSGLIITPFLNILIDFGLLQKFNVYINTNLLEPVFHLCWHLTSISSTCFVQQAFPLSYCPCTMKGKCGVIQTVYFIPSVPVRAHLESP